MAGFDLTTEAYNLTIPLTEAYLRCHDLKNLRAVHRSSEVQQRAES
jgi:hypothetical protein